MKLKGNYILMFVVQFLSGIWTYYACLQFGIMGVIWGFLPFLVAMVLVQKNHTPDERELALIHKTDSIKGIVIAVAMAVVYMWFPDMNWFYIFVSSISVSRGVVGTVLFLAN